MIWVAAAGASLAAPTVAADHIEEVQAPVIYIYRPGMLSGSALTEEITVDHRRALILSNNGCSKIYLTPGLHHIEVDWYQPLHLFALTTKRLTGPIQADVPLKFGDKLYFKVTRTGAPGDSPHTYEIILQMTRQLESVATGEMRSCRRISAEKPFDIPVSEPSAEPAAGSPN